MSNTTEIVGNCPVMGEVDEGDTAWLVVSSALVLIQTPGVAFFYGGMVRRKNMVNTIFLSFAAAGVVMIQWVLFGYSLAFGNGTKGLGNFNWGGLKGVSTATPNADYAPTVPHLAFANFQMMFAVITPALISGAVVERVSSLTWLVFVFLWTTLVYDPLAHWVWSAGSQYSSDGTECTYVTGWLRDMGAIDFAGGTVIHISSGMAGLVISLLIGKRHNVDRKKPHAPASVPFIILGCTLIWFGWLGFNGGSAAASGPLAVLAATNTSIAAAAGFLTWLLTDLAFNKGVKASLVGASIGLVVSLVAITPASGYIYPGYSILFGVFPIWPSYFLMKYKHLLPFDDALDVFFCHGVGGMMGALMTGLFATTDVNPYGAEGAFYGNGRQLGIQILAVVIAIAYSAVGTAVICIFLKYTIGLRASEEGQNDGMDRHYHDEEAFDEGEYMLERIANRVIQKMKAAETNSASSGETLEVALEMTEGKHQSNPELQQTNSGKSIS
ncbi:ammonium transporter [Planoprotostelium fungivorum]|uniref:Ammonium transporter n=1 Tax=Planoprotostelium fungivorum TaxID=1890364 RepID=A0A2P6NJU5_9EUKA|nr:ammonium transporter [Planoprotostelium fungivorum]